MAQKLKLFLGMAGLALLIVVAMVAYNMLVSRVDPADRFAFLEEWDGAEAEVYAHRHEAPDFALVDWDGNSRRFSDLATGQPTVLNFWASWCPSCRLEKPGFEMVYRDRGAEVKFVMLGLADGVRETVETGQRYIEEGGFTLPVYFDTLQEGVMAHGIRFLPTTVFIDREGYIVTEMVGAVDEQTLRAVIDFLLGTAD